MFDRVRAIVEESLKWQVTREPDLTEKSRKIMFENLDDPEEKKKVKDVLKLVTEEVWRMQSEDMGVLDEQTADKV